MSNNQNFSTEMETPAVEDFFFVPKMHFTQGECSQATCTKIFTSKPIDGSAYFVPEKHFTEGESLQAIDTKFISSKPVDRSAMKIENPPFLQNEALYAGNVRTSDFALSFNNAFFNKESGDRLGFDIAMPLHQKESSQDSGSVFQSSKLVDEIASRIEKLPFLQKTCPLMTHAKIVKISETKENSEASYYKEFLQQMRYVTDLSSCGLNADKILRKEPSSDEQIEDIRRVNENLFCGRSENLGKDNRISRSEQREFRFGNLLSSSGRDEEPYSASEDFLNKRIEKIANQLLAINYANSQQAEDSYFKYNSLQDNSFTYRQLYLKTHPNNYDFAMKLMAYIEFLNDKFWRATRSYLNNNVKKVVGYLWKGVIDYVNSQTELQIIDINTFQQMLVEFTQTWDQRGNLNLEQFLNYCIIMCQIGVRARKQKLKEAPSHVIFLLRNRLEEIENYQHNYFESIVENYAEELVKSFRL